MEKKYGIPVRIDSELNDMIKEIAKKNKISFREASKQFGKVAKVNIKGKKIIREIEF